MDLAKSVFTTDCTRPCFKGLMSLWSLKLDSYFQALAKLPLILADYRDIKRVGIHQSTDKTL